MAAPILTKRSEMPLEFRRRLAITVGIVVVLFSLTLVRLWNLQIAEGEQYRSLSEHNRIRLRRVRATRGVILDRNGEVVVDNRPSFDLVLVPEDAQDVPRTIATLTRLLGPEAGDLGAIVAAARNRPPFEEIVLLRDLDWERTVKIETHQFELPGVSVQVGPRRTYPFGEMAGHLFGYVGQVNQRELESRAGYHLGDLIGKAGVERQWEDYLRGIDGGQQIEVDALGRKLRVLSEVPETPGHNLVLTLDRELQLAAEHALGEQAGAVVAIDPRNGEVLAMASRPAFDPNVFARGIRHDEWQALTEDERNPLRSRALQGTYPPGSTFKIVMAAAALEEGVVNPFTRLYCSGGLRFGNRTFRCWRRGGHGSVNLHDALVYSCDVFFYQVGQRLGVDTIAEYARRFGLGAVTGIGFEHEGEGIIPDRNWKQARFGEPWYPGETLSVAIGQGYVTATPLQMANLTAALANGGTVLRPRVVQRAETGAGEVVFADQSLPIGDLGLKKSTVRQIREALFGVVNSPRGTGARAKLAGVEVGGKTGTSQVRRLGKNRDITHGIPRQFRDHAWFVAFAPVANPEIAIAVLVEHAGEGGGKVAAPIARTVLARYFGMDDGDEVMDRVASFTHEHDDATIRPTARLPF
jgi:penicillin-binding protein 2